MISILTLLQCSSATSYIEEGLTIEDLGPPQTLKKPLREPFEILEDELQSPNYDSSKRQLPAKVLPAKAFDLKHSNAAKFPEKRHMIQLRDSSIKPMVENASNTPFTKDIPISYPKDYTTPRNAETMIQVLDSSTFKYGGIEKQYGYKLLTDLASTKMDDLGGFSITEDANEAMNDHSMTSMPCPTDLEDQKRRRFLHQASFGTFLGEISEYPDHTIWTTAPVPVCTEDYELFPGYPLNQDLRLVDINFPGQNGAPIQPPSMRNESTNCKNIYSRTQNDAPLSEPSVDLLEQFYVTSRSKGQCYACSDKICSNFLKDPARTKKMKNQSFLSTLTGYNDRDHGLLHEGGYLTNIIAQFHRVHYNERMAPNLVTEHAPVSSKLTSHFPYELILPFSSYFGGTRCYNDSVMLNSADFSAPLRDKDALPRRYQAAPTVSNVRANLQCKPTSPSKNIQQNYFVTALTTEQLKDQRASATCNAPTIESAHEKEYPSIFAQWFMPTETYTWTNSLTYFLQLVLSFSLLMLSWEIPRFKGGSPGFMGRFHTGLASCGRVFMLPDHQAAHHYNAFIDPYHDNSSSKAYFSCTPYLKIRYYLSSCLFFITHVMNDKVTRMIFSLTSVKCKEEKHTKAGFSYHLLQNNWRLFIRIFLYSLLKMVSICIWQIVLLTKYVRMLFSKDPVVAYKAYKKEHAPTLRHTEWLQGELNRHRKKWKQEWKLRMQAEQFDTQASPILGSSEHLQSLTQRILDTQIRIDQEDELCQNHVTYYQYESTMPTTIKLSKLS